MITVTKNTIRLGPVSINIRNGSVNYDGRSLRHAPTSFKIMATVGAAVATLVVANAITKK